MRNIKAIFIKQLQSLVKNPGLLVQAVLFMGVILIISFLASEDTPCDDCIPAYVCAQCLEGKASLDTPNPSMTGLFAVMFVGLTLVGHASALVYEDKNTQNLRFMTMAAVKPKEYMIGTAASLVVISSGVVVLFALVGRYLGADMLWFVAVGGLGMLVSALLGVTIALSKYPVLASPISLLLGLGPMLSTFNETLARALRFTYTQQINLAFSDLSADLTRNFMIIGANGAVVLLLFIWVSWKGKLT